MTKRAFDFVAALLGLLVLAPVFLVVAVAVGLGSPGPILFMQKRVGRAYRPFWIYKFRTMVVGAARGGSITWGGAEDPRITPVGRFLRRTKLDELPQLLNVLKGEMSFVGPRPEVPEYVERFPEEFREILKVRPGITDFASLEFRHEAALLARSATPEETYVSEILPEKLRLSQEYVRSSSLRLDLMLIFRTLFSIWMPAGAPPNRGVR
jgi:lipopolysaccharide/colanic/teichoic acid biosynthesis glycosyltransferase